jgi:hypothetical protein
MTLSQVKLDEAATNPVRIHSGQEKLNFGSLGGARLNEILHHKAAEDAEKKILSRNTPNSANSVSP